MEQQGVNGIVLIRTEDESIGSTNSQRRCEHYERIDWLSG